MTLNLVLELHAVLMAGVRGQDKAPGWLRTVQRWSPARGVRVMRNTIGAG